MNIRHIAFCILVPMWISASAATYFSVQPNSTRFPADVSTQNVNGVVPVKSMYKHGYTAEGWTIETIDGSTYSFLAPSYSATEDAQDSRLITLPFTVETENSWLRWRAKSVLPGFPEAYDVVVTESGNDESVILTSVEEEDYEWHTRLVSLKEFAGKDISVAFVCRSVNKYMLAVQNIFAGEFDTQEWIANNVTSRYASFSDGIAATGSILNIGADVENAMIVCRVGDLELSSEIINPWATAEAFDYYFDLPLALNETTSYTIGIQDNEGIFTPLVSSDVFASNFVRNLVVDEGTGMWCPNCPDGILKLEKLKREYGDNIIELSCHVNDVFALDNYWANLQFYSVPYMMLNRNRATAGESAKNFTKEYVAPTFAEILLPTSVNREDKEMEVQAVCRFAEALDNGGDRYRVGYTIKGDIFSPLTLEYYQENNLNFAIGQQYYLLPMVIPSSLARFENVVFDEEFAFSGIEGSLPETISAMTDYSVSLKFALPSLAEEANNVEIVAYILDTTTGEIMNAAVSSVVTSNGIGYVTDKGSGDNLSIRISPDGKCFVQGLGNNESLGIKVADAAGRVFDNVQTTREALESMSLRLPKGIVIVTLSTATQSVVTKCFTP